MDYTVMAPYVQWGFAGFCFVVFGTLTTVNVWLIKQMLKILRDSNTVISGNTEAIRSVHTTAEDTKRTMSDIRDQLLRRPCLLPEREARAQGREDRAQERENRAQSHEDKIANGEPSP